MGDLKGAEALQREALQGKRETLGDQHPTTLNSVINLALVLQDLGDLKGAEALCREALQGYREQAGARSMGTLFTIGNLADVLREKGELSAASAELGDTVAVAAEVLGPEHMFTLRIEVQAARLGLAHTGDAAPLREVVKRMETVLGATHQYTKKYAKVVQEL